MFLVQNKIPITRWAYFKLRRHWIWLTLLCQNEPWLMGLMVINDTKYSTLERWSMPQIVPIINSNHQVTICNAFIPPNNEVVNQQQHTNTTRHFYRSSNFEQELTRSLLSLPRWHPTSVGAAEAAGVLASPRGPRRCRLKLTGSRSGSDRY